MTFTHKIILIFCLQICFTHISLATSIDELKITSDHLTIQKNQSTATFTNNVVVFFDNLKLTTTKLIIYYTDINKKKAITKIVIPEKLTAIRNCGREVVIANKGIFDNSTKKLILEGNIALQKEGNILITDKLIYSSSLKKK